MVCNVKCLSHFISYKGEYRVSPKFLGKNTNLNVFTLRYRHILADLAVHQDWIIPQVCGLQSIRNKNENQKL